MPNDLRCPLCQRFLYNRETGSRIAKTNNCNFFCPKTFTINGLPIFHYHRFTIQTGGFLYTIQIPPYCIEWTDLQKIVTVYLTESLHETDWKHVLTQPDASYDDFVNLYHRFNKLKVFL